MTCLWRRHKKSGYVATYLAYLPDILKKYVRRFIVESISGKDPRSGIIFTSLMLVILDFVFVMAYRAIFVSEEKRPAAG